MSENYWGDGGADGGEWGPLLHNVGIESKSTLSEVTKTCWVFPTSRGTDPRAGTGCVTLLPVTSATGLPLEGPRRWGSLMGIIYVDLRPPQSQQRTVGVEGSPKASAKGAPSRRPLPRTEEVIGTKPRTKWSVGDRGRKQARTGPEDRRGGTAVRGVLAA